MTNLNEAIKVYLSPIIKEYLEEYLVSKITPLFDDVLNEYREKHKEFLEQLEKTKYEYIKYLTEKSKNINSSIEKKLKSISDNHKEFNVIKDNLFSRMQEIEAMIRSHAVGVQNVYNDIKSLKDAQIKNSDRISIIDDILDSDNKLSQNIFIELENIRKIINKSKTVGEKKIVNSSVVKPKTVLKSRIDQVKGVTSHGRDKTRRSGKNKD